MEDKQELLERMVTYPEIAADYRRRIQALQKEFGELTFNIKYTRSPFPGTNVKIPAGCEAYTVELVAPIKTEDVPYEVTKEDAEKEWVVETVFLLENDVCSFKLRNGGAVIYVPAEHITLA